MVMEKPSVVGSGQRDHGAYQGTSEPVRLADMLVVPLDSVGQRHSREGVHLALVQRLQSLVSALLAVQDAARWPKGLVCKGVGDARTKFRPVPSRQCARHT